MLYLCHNQLVNNTEAKIGYGERVLYYMRTPKEERHVQKAIFSILILIWVMLFGLTEAHASDRIVQFTISSNKYFLNEQEKTMDVVPCIINDSTYVPIRYVAEALEISPENILWNDREKFVTLIKPGKVVDLGVYVYWILVNGKTVEIDRAPPIMVNDRVYIPLRVVAEIFGCEVDWNGDTQTVTIKQSSVDSNSVKLSPLVYTWTFENKVYTLNPGKIPAFKNIYTPEKTLVILHRYKLKAHPLFQREYPEIQGPMLQWMENTIKHYTKDTDNKEIISAFASILKEIANKSGIRDDKKLAQFVISFCQYIPYKKDSPPFQFLIEFDEYPKYPLETLLEKEGDCEDKSMLAAVLLRELGYKTALVLYPDHMAIGISLPETKVSNNSYYLTSDGRKYLYTEISKDWPIGIIPDKLKGKPHLLFPLDE